MTYKWETCKIIICKNIWRVVTRSELKHRLVSWLSLILRKFSKWLFARDRSQLQRIDQWDIDKTSSMQNVFFSYETYFKSVLCDRSFLTRAINEIRRRNLKNLETYGVERKFRPTTVWDEDEPSWSREMWDQLPELILTQIFSHLNRVDRANVGQVCRSWNRTLSSPVLWRSVTVLIDRDLRGDFPLAGELAVR